MSRKVNLIPMAGAGQRFVDAGYTLPKPLIPVDGLPMAVRAAASLPPADLWIFLCRTEHLAGHPLESTLGRHFPGCVVVPVERLTEGQASTCLLARTLLKPDDRLVIGACDYTMEWSAAQHAAVSAADALVWTFRGNPAVLRKPEAWGWVQADGSGRVARVSCKKPVSETPLADPAVIGTFSFRRAEEFLACADRMIRDNERVNGEFYVDVVADVAARHGRDVRLMEVERFTALGTPADLEAWQAAAGAGS